MQLLYLKLRGLFGAAIKEFFGAHVFAIIATAIFWLAEYTA
jgi:hypothetical protein